MLTPVEIEWDDNERKRVRRVERLDALLDRLDAEARGLGLLLQVELVRRGGGALAIVLGGERSVVSHVPADTDPPYSISVGEQRLESRPFRFYMYGDHHSQVGWRHTVPTDAARDAAREFLRTGRLDPRIRWEKT